MHKLTLEERRAQRLFIARTIASEGGSTGNVATAWGTTTANVSMMLRKYDDDLRKELAANAVCTRITPDLAVKRLEAVAAHGVSGGARTLGMKEHALRGWCKRNAPWGIHDALMDYRDELAA